ncbi:MAG: ParB family protein [Aeromonas sp.]
MSKRVPIGRKFSSEMINIEPVDQNNSDNNAHVFTLASDKQVSFVLEEIAADILATKTFVDPLINGRDQAALTPESVADITRTLPLQQFFPAIGCRRADGQIEILDGSRRRAAALYTQSALKILVCNEVISAEDARQLAADIQTAREHNIREVGLRLMALRDSGMNQKEIAQSQGLSAAKVTRALQAATVPAEMLSVFPVIAELSHADYKQLLDIVALVEKQATTLASIVACVQSMRADLPTHLPMDQVKEKLLGAFKSEAAALIAKPAQAKAIIKPLWAFDDKNAYARRKSKDRMVSYEFSRMPNELIAELDELIALSISDFFQRT